MSGTRTRAHGRITGRTAARAEARARCHLRVRKKITGSAARPRLVVTRSARHMFAQLVDETAKAKQVGVLLAERASKVGITAAVFDRGGHAYHGRVAALADSAREGGLQL